MDLVAIMTCICYFVLAKLPEDQLKHRNIKKYTNKYNKHVEKRY